MTSIRAASVQPNTFLRRVLWLDAIGCAALGLLLLACGRQLAGPLNLSDDLLWRVSLLLLPVALVVGFIGTRARLPRVVVWGVIAVNAVWAIDSVVLLFTRWVQPSLLGQLFVIGQAAFAAVVAELQYIGLRKSADVAVPMHS